ncbi:PREDICTED: anthocyanidin 3-O-glucosyltransferase [Prunus dulcis]|uniref:Glycosyltransferase n=1 Tax=Prunus dulcis TaxID=3755 RepID=A0A5E4FJB1_PRUDU|nr:UDP-glycosyltransferase 71A16-like [Prunus dulcis]VVA27826.1 PREDICTED: anthocyanidin 3-O-glucosyltransferase [Prunus dulcis]
MKRPAELVFIPAAGIGHVVSTIEIAKLLVSRDDRLFITLLIMKRPFDKLFTNTDSSISPRINFVNLPDTETTDLSCFKFFVENQKTQVRDAVAKLVESNQSGSSKPRLAGFVVDMFCTTMIDVANEFEVPSYVFFTSSAACLGLLFHLQTLRDEHGKDVAEFAHSDSDLVVPSFVNPLPASVLPGKLLDKESAESFLNYARRFRETKGILVNTFWELESHALHSISYGKNPPVYPVGPLLNIKSSDDDKVWDILSWLHDQPPLSVVFLCFGSMGSFGEAQVKEIAYALEHTGLRFLWSLRQPPPKGKMAMPSDYADPSGVLPEGFLDRTAKIGKVIGWAPQVDILAHSSIGGFVSHCGWNSTLESLWYGVPVATWPMYAEQQTNAFQLVKELGLAVEIKLDYRKDSEVVVSAQDIERGIRQVMEHDSVIRKRVKEISEKSKKSLMNGGSSCSSLGRFIDQI